jgi:hypothetical protein
MKADRIPLLDRAKRALLLAYRIITLNFTRRLSDAWLRFGPKDNRTFSAQVQLKMAHDRSAQLVMFADKVHVREFVGRTIGEKYLALHHFSAGSLTEINWDQLPREFVIKVNHGCGGNIIVWDGAEQGASLPSKLQNVGWGHFVVKPEALNRVSATNLVNYWLDLDYSWELGRRFPEWVYGEIKPQVLVEELLTNPDESLPVDYKFFCFHGKVAMIQVDTERMTAHKRALLTPTWELLNTRYTYPIPETVPGPPKNLSEMIDVAEKLSAKVDFVRVDLYSVGSRVVFGELTNFPDGGGIKFKPRALDFELGALLRPSSG